jgi:hypothetical protein
MMGNVKYMFNGTVSRDWKEWVTGYMQEFDFGPRFPVDPNDTVEQVIFEKAAN